MKDALGAVQSVLVLGGNSDIAAATLKRLVSQRTRNVVLAGRNLDSMKQLAVDLEQSGADAVEIAAFDAVDFSSHASFVEAQFNKHGQFDLVILAFGVLGEQQADAADSARAVDVVNANFTGAVSVLLPVADKLKKQGHGNIVVLSSVAGERARAANYIYGSTKAGLDAFCQGLGDDLVSSGIGLMIVRPGFVTTKMTAGMPTKPMSTTADLVADEIIKGLARGSEIVWAPAKLRFVLFVMRHLPRSIFRKIKQ